MESSLQRFGRLLGALESLSDQAFCSFHAQDYLGALAIQERCQPVIDEISRLMVEPGLARALSPATRVRLDRLLKRQADQIDRISADKAVVKEELRSLRTAQSRTQDLRSTYGRTEDPSPPSNYAETG